MHCFLKQKRECDSDCVAFTETGKTNCRLINAFEKLIPIPVRPTAPPPKVQ